MKTIDEVDFFLNSLKKTRFALSCFKKSLLITYTLPFVMSAICKKVANRISNSYKTYQTIYTTLLRFAQLALLSCLRKNYLVRFVLLEQTARINQWSKQFIPLYWVTYNPPYIQFYWFHYSCFQVWVFHEKSTELKYSA